MALVSMDVEEADDNCCLSGNWGLQINLSDDQVEALGLEANPPKAGSVVALRALAKVVTVTQNADANDDDQDVDVTLRLEITDLEVTPDGVKPQEQQARVLYGG